jgi:Lipase
VEALGSLYYKPILYCYGFTSDFFDKSSQATIHAYQQRGNFTMFFIEWSKYNSGNFLLNAVHNANVVARLVSKALWDLHVKEIIDLSSFDFIGNSLGGHLVAFISRQIKFFSENSLIIKKIVATDPAGPTFYESIALRILQKPLNADDG